MKLDKAYKLSLPKDMAELLERKAAERGPGTKVVALVREAIHKVYFSKEEPRKKVSKKTG